MEDAVERRPRAPSRSVSTAILPRGLGPSWYYAYYIPSIRWMGRYEWRKSFLGDLFAGLTLTSFQLPVSLSYASSLAGVNPICGLYGLIVPPLIYAFFGGVPPMVVAPEGPTSLIMSVAVAPYFNEGHMHGRSDLDSEQISALIAGTAGGITLALGLFRAGFLSCLLSQSLLRGFISGVGFVMIADQLPSQLGISSQMKKELPPGVSSYDKMKFLYYNWRDSDKYSVYFAGSALLGILLIKKLKTRLATNGHKKALLFPEILLIVIISAVCCQSLGIAEKGLEIVGDVTPGRVETQWMLRPKFWSDFKINFQISSFIAVLGILDSTVASRLLGDAEAASANRELVAIGLSNLIGGLFGALPSFGGYGRSKVNLLSGGTTQMSAIVASITTLFATYQLMGYLYFLPKCVLSSIISSIGISLISEMPEDLQTFWRLRSVADLTTIIVSILVTFFWSVQAGVVSGVLVAVFRIIHHATRPRIQILAKDPGTSAFVNADEMPEESPGHIFSGILVVKIPEPLTFANITTFEERLRRFELHRTAKAHPGQPSSYQPDELHAVVFHLKGMTQIDATAAVSLARILERYLNRRVRIVFTELVRDLKVWDTLSRSGVLELLESQPKPAFYNNVEQAIFNIDAS